jgi:hypothetical protein
MLFWAYLDHEPLKIDILTSSVARINATELDPSVPKGHRSIICAG